jgi:hypothetical protein
MFRAFSLRRNPIGETITRNWLRELRRSVFQRDDRESFVDGLLHFYFRWLPFRSTSVPRIPFCGVRRKDSAAARLANAE